jgi:acyl-CoA thioesterase
VKTPEEIVNLMMKTDAFSNWMQVEIESIRPGYCKLKTRVHSDMLNGFGIAHGGISYSLSDSALAFASNAYGKQCVSIETAISHLRPAKLNDELNVICTEIHRGRSLAIYIVTITNQDGVVISHFKGTVHISENSW